MAEAKHKYFLVQSNINKTISKTNNGEIYASGDNDPICLRYVGKYRQFCSTSGIAAVNAESGTQKTEYNFKLLFGPDEILPSNQGTKSDQFVGNKFYWKNTVFSMQYDPTPYITFIRQLQGQGFGGAYYPESLKTITFAAYNETETPGNVAIRATGNADGTLGNIASIQNVVNRDSVANFDRIEVGTHNPNTGNSRLAFAMANYNTNNNVEAFRAVGSQGTIAVPQHTAAESSNVYVNYRNMQPISGQNKYSITSVGQGAIQSFPLFMAPQFKFYYYTRIIVFKFKLPMSNFDSLYHDWNQQENFLNALWWQRNQDVTKPNYSIRSSVLNDNNAYGGTFRVVYNRLIKINPAKRYIFRFNFGSKKRKGDLITLKTGDPFAPVPDPEELDEDAHLYSNACYLGFMLPPIHPDDFDYFAANVLENNSPYDPYKNGRLHKMSAIKSPQEVGDESTYDGPYLPTYNEGVYTGVNVGTTLNLGAIYLSGRTCFID